MNFAGFGLRLGGTTWPRIWRLATSLINVCQKVTQCKLVIRNVIRMPKATQCKLLTRRIYVLPTCLLHSFTSSVCCQPRAGRSLSLPTPDSALATRVEEPGPGMCVIPLASLQHIQPKVSPKSDQTLEREKCCKSHEVGMVGCRTPYCEWMQWVVPELTVAAPAVPDKTTVCLKYQHVIRRTPASWQPLPQVRRIRSLQMQGNLSVRHIGTHFSSESQEPSAIALYSLTT